MTDCTVFVSRPNSQNANETERLRKELLLKNLPLEMDGHADSTKT